MGIWMSEWYLSAESPERFTDASARAARSAAELTAEASDHPVRLLRSLFVPEDETCYLLFEADSGDEVLRVNQLAGIPSDRVQAVIELTDEPSTSSRGFE